MLTIGFADGAFTAATMEGTAGEGAGSVRTGMGAGMIGSTTGSAAGISMWPLGGGKSGVLCRMMTTLPPITTMTTCRSREKVRKREAKI